MRRRSLRPKEWKPIHRFAFAVIGMMFVGSGSLSLSSGKLHYPNYWHVLAFAPFAILIGVIFFAAALAIRTGA
jgi:hypothetical protein